jgi:AcrR family transcriptional regulator
MGLFMKEQTFENRHKRTFDNIPEEKRERILKCATEEFALNGYENANISAIAKAADISVGSIYKYFEGKQDLFLTVVHHGINRIDTVLGNLLEEDVDVLVKVERIIRELQDFSRTQGTLIKLYNEITGENDDNLARQLAEAMEGVSASVYKTAIEQGKSSGEIRQDIDTGMAAFMLDNLFMSLQFSYSCEYYSERFKMFTDENILERDDFVVEQMLKFIKSAFKYK